MVESHSSLGLAWESSLAATHLQDESIGSESEGEAYGNMALCRLALQNLFKGHVVVAIQGKSWPQVARHLVGIESVAHGAVYPESLQPMVVGDEAESVAIAEGCRTGHIEGVAAHLFHVTNVLAQCLWCVETGDVGLTAT